MSQIDWSKAPKDATHFDCRQSVYPAFMKKMSGADNWQFYSGGCWHIYGRLDLSEENKMMVRPERMEWTGEGLPPVGKVCEVDYCESWKQCEIIAHFKQRCGMVAAFTVDLVDGAKSLDAFGSESFRPIRTPEQIAAEELREIIESGLNGKKTLGEVVNEIIVNGYRKFEIVENEE